MTKISSRFPCLLLVLFAPLILLTGCLQFPLGDSRGGHYFGGYGQVGSSGLRPGAYVPRQVQKDNSMTMHP